MSGIKKIIQKKRNNNANKIKKETVRETLEEFRTVKHYENLKNYILLGAVDHGDVETVREALSQGADPNFRLYSQTESLMKIATNQPNTEIIKLLIQHGVTIDKDLMNHIFLYQRHASKRTREVVVSILKHNKTLEILHMIFNYLLEYNMITERLNILVYLLDHGLSLKSFITAGMTALHLSVKHKKTDFVLELLKRGADIDKKTQTEKSCLWLAVRNDDASMVKLLLKKGANINERSQKGETVLHLAHSDDLISRKMIRLLVRHGADINILDNLGHTPLTSQHNTLFFSQRKKIIVKELAKLSCENQYICSDNLEYLKLESVKGYFKECTDELTLMKDRKVYSNYSLYDILRMREQPKKLIYLSKKKDFVTSFESFGWDDDITHFNHDLKNIFNKAVKKRNIIQTEEKKLHSVFKDYLPDLVIRKTAYFVNEDLFFESDNETEFEFESDLDSDFDNEEDSDSSMNMEYYGFDEYENYGDDYW